MGLFSGGLIFGGDYHQNFTVQLLDTLYPISFVLAQPTMITGGFNPLSPKSDQHQISPYNINT